VTFSDRPLVVDVAAAEAEQREVVKFVGQKEGILEGIDDALGFVAGAEIASQADAQNEGSGQEEQAAVFFMLGAGDMNAHCGTGAGRKAEGAKRNSMGEA
jgi:hypothetical protein